jgi:hypothetical protein
VGAPHWFCYRDGEFLGTEKDLNAAKSRCVKNERRPCVMEFETTEQAHKRLKPKPVKGWKDSGVRDEWIANVEGEPLPARIRMLDKRTFTCYRDGEYLGSEESRALAEMRVAIGERSHKNQVMTLWEQKHPGELPPAMQLTEAERAEYWRRNPPKAAAAPPRVGRGAAPRPNEDPATAKLRAELAADGGGRKPGAARKPRVDAAEVPQGTIRVRGTNPKKAGTGAHARWKLLLEHDGKTVAEFLKAKGNPTTLQNALAKKVVEVEK